MKKEEKKSGKKKLTKAGRRFFQIVLIAALCVAGYSGYQLYAGIKEYRDSQNAYAELAAAVETVPEASAAAEDPLPSGVTRADFTKLAGINSDVAGWLTLPDSEIDYPIVQGTDNEYYLEHLFDGTVNHSGCIFIDYTNSPGFTDRNTVMYAHHMRNGSMFADVEKYREQDWYDSHKVLYLQTPDAIYQLEPFAGILTDGAAGYVQISFESDEAFSAYVQDKIDQSTFTSDVTVSSEDQIVTLSTCRYDAYNGRYALFCKLTKIA
ncbi:MAG: class B sortase [Bulleidia sp.]